MEPNPFTKQGEALSCEVRDIILEKWLEGSKPFEIGLQLNLPRKTVSNIVDRFVRTESVQPGVGGNRLRTARTDDVVLYTEFCKRQRPSIRWPTTVTSKPNAHIKFKSLTSNSNRSQQIQIAHSKFKSLTANYKSLTANYKSLTANSNRPQQIQIVHSKFKSFTAN